MNKKRIHSLVRQGLVYSLLLAIAILGLGGVCLLYTSDAADE